MRAEILLFMFVILISSVSALKITEFESNPEGTDAGNEWIELYSEEEVDLGNYKLVNNDGNEIVLNESFSGYFVYIFEKQWLDNSDEKVLLYENESLIDETEVFDDSKNNDMTWQLCDSWEFKLSTKGEENSCDEVPEEPVEETEEEEQEQEEEENVVEERSEIEEYQEIEEPVSRETEPIELQTINLNPQVIKSEDDNENLSKSNYAIYGLVFFCVLLVVLFILRKNKYNKNEFR